MRLRIALITGLLGWTVACTGSLKEKTKAGEGRLSGQNEAPFEFTCTQTNDGLSASRLWRLTNVQFKNTLHTVLSGRAAVDTPVPDTIQAPFYEGSDPTERFTTTAAPSIDSTELSNLIDISFGTSDTLVTQYNASHNKCLESTNRTTFGNCVSDLIAQKGELILRRPLSTEAISRYQTVALDALKTLEPLVAAGAAIDAMLTSPYAIFRNELGTPDPATPGLNKLTPFEIAEAVAYSLGDTPPDESLWSLAQSGALAQSDQVVAQVARVLEQRGSTKVQDFLRQYFKYDGIRGVSKSMEGYDPNALLADTDAWVLNLIKTGTEKDFFKQLLTSTDVYASSQTYKTYGLSSNTSATPVKASAPANQRAGILTQPSFLITFSGMNINHPIQRGKFIRESLLCGEVPPLPIDQVVALPEDPNRTLRERLDMHNQGTCKGCHTLMDPLGLTFEQYDHLGVYRTMELGRPVVTSGELTGSVDQDGPVAGPSELAQRIADSTAGRQCLERHSFRYFSGRSEQAADGCAMVDADKAYQESGGSFVKFLQTLFTSKSFLYRRGGN